MSEPADQELTRLANALQALVPRPANLDRDRVMFEAGQAAGRAPGPWRLATLGASLVAACLAAVLLLREPPVRVIELGQAPNRTRPQPVQPSPEDFADAASPASAPQEAPSEHSLWRLQQTALQMGVDEVLAPADATPMVGAAPPGSAVPSVGSRSYPATLAITGDF
jgi:hypothetical protein